MDKYERAEAGREMLRGGARPEEAAEALGASRQAVDRWRRDVAEERRREDDERPAVAVWSWHLLGSTPPEIDAELGIRNSREVIVAEWLRDKQRRPSLVKGVTRRV